MLFAKSEERLIIPMKFRVLSQTVLPTDFEVEVEVEFEFDINVNVNVINIGRCVCRLANKSIAVRRNIRFARNHIDFMSIKPNGN